MPAYSGNSNNIVVRNNINENNDLKHGRREWRGAMEGMESKNIIRSVVFS